MITTVLHDRNHKEIARIEQPGNDSYLITEQVDDPRYPLLSQLDNCSYTVFDTSDMKQVIKELEAMASALTPEHRKHVEDIIRLARMCQENEGFTLIFTPFGSFLDNPIETHILEESKLAV